MRVVVSAHNVVNYLEGGGHFWVYMQYVQGLRSAGCDVWWMEEFHPSDNSEADRSRVSIFSERLAHYGLRDKLILYTRAGEYLTTCTEKAEMVFRDTDLLLNFHQKIQPQLLEKFRVTA